MKDRSQRIVVTLSREMYEAIKALADDNRRPMAEEVRIAIEEQLKKAAPRKDKASPQFAAVGAR